MRKHLYPGVDTPREFDRIAARMRAEGLPERFIRVFNYYYDQLLAGQTGLVSEAELTPVGSLPDASALTAAHEHTGEAALPKTIMIKLNGGLGTTMGLDRAKSLLPVKNGLTFLDITARHALQTGVPLMLMNSFATHADSLAALRGYQPLWDYPFGVGFLQHKVPRIRQSDYTMVRWQPDPTLEWSPPGHGDIYLALSTSGLLDKLLAAGYEYAFVSNIDNLGAFVDRKILGYFVEHQLAFMMEVTQRTEADRKGGHLARSREGKLLLRELAQTPPEEAAQFQDITLHQFFNTNNLWLNLHALSQALKERKDILGLPLIRNAKQIDPRNPASPHVYQVETAMGTAISVFERVEAMAVPRTRFSPVKSTDDLLVVRSDAFILTEDYRLTPNPKCAALPVVRLDPACYRFIDQFEARFPDGAPGLVACDHLEVEGDVIFGGGVVLKGRVRLCNRTGRPFTLPQGSQFSGEWEAV